MPIGSHTWSFSSALCSGRPSTLKLTISACSSGYFTCGDGSCVAFNERCDRRTNCNDYSDEEDCSVLVRIVIIIVLLLLSVSVVIIIMIGLVINIYCIIFYIECIIIFGHWSKF